MTKPREGLLGFCNFRVVAIESCFVNKSLCGAEGWGNRSILFQNSDQKCRKFLLALERIIILWGSKNPLLISLEPHLQSTLYISRFYIKSSPFLVILTSVINKTRITKPFILKLVDRTVTILQRSIIKEVSQSKSLGY